MDTHPDLTVTSGKLTVLVAFGHGGELDKKQLVKLFGSGVIAERWHKPLELERSESEAVINSGNEKITCSASIHTDVFIAGVSILRTEIEIRNSISLNDILLSLYSNRIFIEGTDFQLFTNLKIQEIRKKLNAGKKKSYFPLTKRYFLLKLEDFSPRIDQSGLKEHYGEVITRFLSGETSTRRLHAKEIREKIANDISYYDEDLYLASSESAFILGCEDYCNEVRELLELSICLLLLFQIYDSKIDIEITNAFESIKKLRSSKYYFLTREPRKLEKSLLKVSEIGLVILDDIEDLMNPHKITPDWYYQSFHQKMLDILKVWDFEKVVAHKISSLQELYTTATELSTGQLTVILELAIVLLILWEVVIPLI